MLCFAAACDISGCFYVPPSGKNAIEFRRPAVELVIGDSREFTEKDFIYTSEKNVFPGGKLAVGDTKIAEVADMKVSAKTLGKTSLSITTPDGKQALCTLEVIGDVRALELTTDGSPVRTLGEEDYIEIHLILNEGADSPAAYEAAWLVDGEPVNDFTGSVLTLRPLPQPAVYEVEASVESRTGTVTTTPLSVLFCRPFSDAPVLSLLDAETGGQQPPVRAAAGERRFSVSYEETAGDPAPLIEWTVNGEPVQNEDNKDTFSFTPPAAGRYKIGALVNGKAALSEGVSYIEVTERGAVVPSEVMVDYDSAYPAVRVEFLGGSADETFSLEVSGQRTGDVLYTAEVKGAFSFLIPGDKLDLFKEDHYFRVRSLGDSRTEQVYLPSRFSERTTLKKLPEEAKAYLSKFTASNRHLNHYVVSDEAFYELFDYYMLYRPQPVDGVKTSVTFTVYLGYEPESSIERLYSEAFHRAGYTGSYGLGGRYTKNVAEVNIDFYTVSMPDKKTAEADFAPALNALLPAVSGKPPDDVDPAGRLPIDEREKEVAVMTTDQLYRAVECGYKPTPHENSAAERAYRYGRALLNTILDDGMSDAARARAIYDWIMWKVSYDNACVEIAAGDNAVKEAVRYDAFYIEGVFNEQGVSSAVCDGISKAYSLLCNMAGLSCLRINGRVRQQNGKLEGHAWNKVRVDGSWYIVDCTWGDWVYEGINAETATHLYFLKTDAQCGDTHIENEYADYPRTAVMPHSFGRKQVFRLNDETTFSPFLNDAADNAAINELCRNITAYLDEVLPQSGGIEFTTYGGTTISDCAGLEIEIAACADMLKSVLTKMNDANPLLTALKTKFDTVLLIPRADTVLVVVWR
ncbi:MAG: hypothetical protein LBH24_01250 [Clostridiales bacterium]|nr:hypothetical protein [Clostridiales bacterium]